jgi:hypothetical protein
MTDPALTLGAALSGSPAGAALLERLEASRRLAHILAEDPHLRSAGIDPSRPGFFELRGSSLRLAARSPAEAAKLRQGLPRLRQALSQHGFDGIELLVAVQPVQNAYPVPVSRENSHESAPDKAGMDPGRGERVEQVRAFLDKLVITLDNPLLRSTAARLSDGMRERVARTREQADPTEGSPPHA